MTLTRALIPVALMLVTGWHAPAEAQETVTYQYPAWGTSDMTGATFWYAGGDNYEIMYYEGGGAGLPWGYSDTYWFAESWYGEPIRGVDHGHTSTFDIFVTMDPLDPDAQPTMIVQAHHDASLRVPKTPSRKR